VETLATIVQSAVPIVVTVVMIAVTDAIVDVTTAIANNFLRNSILCDRQSLERRNGVDLKFSINSPVDEIPIQINSLASFWNRVLRWKG
jgi:hypothetical protein